MTFCWTKINVKCVFYTCDAKGSADLQMKFERR